MDLGNSPGGRIIEEDIHRILSGSLPWRYLHGAAVLVTGGTGMLPSFLALTLLYYRREHPGCGLEVSVLAKDPDAAQKMYAPYWREPYFHFIKADVCERTWEPEGFDYAVHGASPADPRRFGQDPASVFLPNVLGLYQVLERSRNSRGVLFLSSGEIYGHLDSTIQTVRETDVGSVDPLNIRSCYAEGKRAGETLCRIWAEQYRVPTRVVRISHTYGPTMNILRDSRSFAEFVRCVVERKDIQLKSDGSAVRPFCYLSDCVDGMLRALLLGEDGQAYNLAGDSYCSILELAELLCRLFPERQLHVVRTLRDTGDPYLEAEKQHVVRIDTHRLKSLGWNPQISVAEGFQRTILSIEAERNG